MYLTINFSYGECKAWIGHPFQEIVDSSKEITGIPRVYLTNLLDRPVTELVFHQNFILVLEIGTANILAQITVGEIFTAEIADEILAIVDRYNPTIEDEANEGRILKFEYKEPDKE